jgi:hypothetical protein
MAINIEALKALAIKSGATSGDLSSLTFAAAAYPSAILALIERVEAAERDAEAWKNLAAMRGSRVDECIALLKQADAIAKGKA